MTNAVAHIATIAAYPIKAELGGGFRGVYLNRETRERLQSDRLADLEAAKFWAKNIAWSKHTGCRYAPLNKKGEYQANVWIDA